jgi:glycosyltransferase involved in cell wall biosynthesis
MRQPAVQKRLNIAYLTVNDPQDRRSWSGTEYSMAKAIERHCGDIHYIGPIHLKSILAGKVVNRFLKKIAGKTYLYTESVSRRLGKTARERISKVPCDVIFSPAGSASLANLEIPIPIVYLSDATFRLVVNYYPEFSGVLKSHQRTADRFEMASIHKARQLVYPSSWAAQSAINDYHADPGRVNVIPFGANLEVPPDRSQVVAVPLTDRCRLLFVGGHWQRKGGEIAFEAFQRLLNLGLDAELSIVGCTPPEHVVHKNLHVFPFLNKNDPDQLSQLEKIYRQAHFFVLPSRAECFSIALCEANAFGIPVLTSDTGGLPDLVRVGTNGFLFPLNARGDQYAACIRDVFSDLQRYASLRSTSRGEFDSRLNWDHWGTQMSEVFQRAVLKVAANDGRYQPSQ